MTRPMILADGVFDPLHDQHVTYLHLAAQVDPACELVVQVSRQTKRVECVPLEARVRVVQALTMVDGTVACASTLEALRLVQPRVYVKGADWQARGVPADEQAFCDAHGVQVEYVDTEGTTSSTALLRAWADLEAHRGAREVDADALVQRRVPFDAAAQGYTDFGHRAAIEARHPEILAQLCHGKTVLDVGCGPGHLVQLLRDHGVNANGIDPYLPPRYAHCSMTPVEDVGDGAADVVVCREVLEHVPVREWGALLHHLFRVARERVYLTTRHTPAPAHPFELTDELAVDPSHITRLPQPFVRALCVVQGGHRDAVWEQALDWQGKGRVLVYKVTR